SSLSNSFFDEYLAKFQLIPEKIYEDLGIERKKFGFFDEHFLAYIAFSLQRNPRLKVHLNSISAIGFYDESNAVEVSLQDIISQYDAIVKYSDFSRFHNKDYTQWLMNFRLFLLNN